MSKTEPLQITPGEVYTTVQDPAFQNWEIRLREDDMRITATMGIDCSVEEECANATLYADAHNTYNALPVLPSELKRRLEEAEANRAALLKERDEAMRLVMQSEGVLIEARVYVDANRDDVRGEYITDTWEEDVERSVSNINATLGSISTFLSTQTPTE